MKRQAIYKAGIGSEGKPYVEGPGDGCNYDGGARGMRQGDARAAQQARSTGELRQPTFKGDCAMSEIQKPRWYVMDADGQARPREGEEDAQASARFFNGTCRAVQMIEATPEWRAAVLAAADGIAGSLFTGVVAPGGPPLVLGEGTKAAYDAARARLGDLLGGGE